MRYLPVFFFILSAFGQTSSRFDWIQKVGSEQDSFVGLVDDPLGNSYIVGNTRSANFPLKSPLQPTLASATASDIFIVKLDPSGNVVYSTCFGGSGDDRAVALAVDPQGNLYITGFTLSADFPVTKGAFLSTAPPRIDLRGSTFLFKINRDGTSAGAVSLDVLNICVKYSILHE